MQILNNKDSSISGEDIDAFSKKRAFPVLGTGADEFEDDFELETYINSKFPDEHSLLNIEDIINELLLEEKRIDDEIGSDLREFSLKNIINNFENNIMEIENNLIPNIKLIEKIGKFSFDEIGVMLNNVQKLDEYGNNLLSISKLLEKSYVYAVVLEEIKKLIKVREYTEITLVLILEHYLRAELISIINDIKLNKTIRSELNNVCEDKIDECMISKLIEESIAEYDGIKVQLEKQMMDDFMSLIDPCILFLNILEDVKSKEELVNANTVITPPQYLQAPERFIKQMRSCCYCVDLVGGYRFRKEVINKFSERLLEPYNKLFSTMNYNSSFNMNRKNRVSNKDKTICYNTYGLELLERRFSWYKRFINEYEQQFGEIFLARWEIMFVLTEKYFFYTRNYILEVLGDNGNNMDSLSLLKYTSICYQFECYVISKFMQIRDQNILLSELEEYKGDLLLFNDNKVDFRLNLSNEIIRKYYEFNILDIRKKVFYNVNRNALLSFPSLQEKELQADSYSEETYPSLRGLLTECFVPYLTSYFDIKKDSLKKKIKELTLNDNMTENSQIKKDSCLSSVAETIPLIWNSCTELFKLINVVFLEIKHLLTYDDIYFQFNNLIMQMGNTYLASIIQNCNITVNGITDKYVQFRNISSGMNSSLENLVETVVNTVSNQTSKVVAAATTGIGIGVSNETGIGTDESTVGRIGSLNIMQNYSNNFNPYLGTGSSIKISNIFGSGSTCVLKYDPKKIGATLGSIDYMEWMYGRLDKMVLKERNNIIITKGRDDFWKKDNHTINKTEEDVKDHDDYHFITTNHNFMFNNCMWVIRRTIIDSLIDDITRNTTQIIKDWYTKKLPKRNDSIQFNTNNDIFTRGLGMINGLSDLNLNISTPSLTDDLYRVFVGGKDKSTGNNNNSYLKYMDYVSNIYKYKIINQAMNKILTDNLNHIINLLKEMQLNSTTINIIMDEINRISLLFLEIPSYYPDIYIPRAYVNTINKLTKRSTEYIRTYAIQKKEETGMVSNSVISS